jgi:uncharacterized membrane protein
MTSVKTIDRGAASRVAEPRRVIARTDEEWRSLWAAHAGPAADAPPVDMTAVTIAAAFAGEKPSAGFSVDITAAEQTAAEQTAAEYAEHADHAGGGVTLVVEERGPGPDAIAAAIITSPFHIVAVPRAAGEVSWQEAGGRRLEVGNSSGYSPTSNLQPPSSTGLEPRTASALAYLAGPFSGALILLAESTNQDVRFHAWQSIVGLGGLGLAVAASYVLAFVALFVSATAVSLMIGVASVLWIVLAIVWAICLWKAWSGERWKLPLAGDYAERFQ